MWLLVEGPSLETSLWGASLKWVKKIQENFRKKVESFEKKSNKKNKKHIHEQNRWAVPYVGYN